MEFFNQLGRRVPTNDMRVFGREPSQYYKLHQPDLDFEKILDRSKLHGTVSSNITNGSEFRAKAESLLAKIRVDLNYAKLTNGVHVPFIVHRTSEDHDLGTDLEQVLLQQVKGAFTERYPEAHFKAILQGHTELKCNISLHQDSRYDRFLSARRTGPVVGWYFPQALQEFDIASQRAQMATLPQLEAASGVCLSGAVDIFASLVGTPELLISEEFYSPILCLSAYVHKDPRLALFLKAYGPHMEFWCMTQMLSPAVTQVSEQWAGGITVYDAL